MKKALSLILTAAVLLLALAACGNQKDGKLVKVTVAASSTPHAEILEKCVDAMKEKGYDLEIRVMDDYVTPNMATDSGDVDANYFQHQPYLDEFNASKKTTLVTVAKVHYEPYGVYTGKCDSFDNLSSGDAIAVPNDATNEARALMLLEKSGVIKLKDGVGLTATKADIVENPLNIDIKEMEAALLPGVLDEVAFAVINGNYALGAGLDISKAVAVEDSASEAAQTYANILVVKAGNENKEAIKALVDVITSPEIAEYINSTYNGAVVAMN